MQDQDYIRKDSALDHNSILPPTGYSSTLQRYSSTLQGYSSTLQASPNIPELYSAHISTPPWGLRVYTLLGLSRGGGPILPPLTFDERTCQPSLGLGRVTGTRLQPHRLEVGWRECPWFTCAGNSPLVYILRSLITRSTTRHHQDVKNDCKNKTWKILVIILWAV